MNEGVLRGLSRVLRLQLAAVQQHFIHVLLLRAWNEEAVADRITSIDAVDLPNAMRIVDCLVSAGHLPALASDRETLAEDMPAPGAGPDAVFAAELALDLRLGAVLTSAERELTPWAGEMPLELVSVPLASRAAYQDWLRRRLEDPREGGEASEARDPARLALDSLFANLMVMITQTLVHAFVHWHRGERELADATWEMSGATMMHATGVVNALAPRQMAPRPARAVVRGEIALPRVAATRPDALESDRQLADGCRAAANRAAAAQRDADLAAACGRIEAWYAELDGWQPGCALPRIDNPCVDFERVLREYVMKRAGHDVRESDPFEAAHSLRALPRTRAPPIVDRLHSLWESMRGPVIAAFLPAPGLPEDAEAYLTSVDDLYRSDAYHSLSIEGYRVDVELIERVRAGDWDPDHRDGDRQSRDALAARGYWQAFQLVRETVRAVIAGDDASARARAAHQDWYRELFQPSVAAGLVPASALAGYRNGPVFLRGSRHVPPRWEAVRDAMPAYFDLLGSEAEPSVKAVLGHWLFGYIHPYADGNGRMARFVMNALLASGGYPWTVIRVDDRDAYLAALERASIEQDVEPFARFVARRVESALDRAGAKP